MKKEKKRKHVSSRRWHQPKGNGINAWIAAVDLIGAVRAGVIDQDLFYCFMP